MAAAMGVMAMASVGSIAFANNHYDTESRLYMDEANGEETAYTIGRSKEDTSSGYIKNCWTTYDCDYSVALVGANYNGGKEYYENFDLVYYKIDGSSQNEYFLTNYVKESGYNYAAIKTFSDYYGYYAVDFLWSPDSV